MKTRPLSSIHTHTIFCDGRDDVETMCRTAYEKNLFAIGFSAHSPIEKQIGSESGWNLKEENVSKYTAEVLAAKQRWQGKIPVFLGYEVDYIKGRRSALDSDITALNLDYTIGSVHYLFPENGANFFTVDGSMEEFERGLSEGYAGDALALMHKYYDAQAEMIKKGGFDILGHPDLLKKNCKDKNYWAKEAELERQREIARLAADAGIVIEVNTGGINRKKTCDVNPSLPFLQLICEYKVPVIITSDAHCANHIDGNYDIALNTIKLADINEHVLFNGRVNGKPIWQKEKL